MKKEAEKVRGLFERPPESGVWWINYYVNGKQHREKAGRRSDAVALYQKRKEDIRRKLKLPSWCRATWSPSGICRPWRWSTPKPT
jgi:hypothetical protein